MGPKMRVRFRTRLKIVFIAGAVVHAQRMSATAAATLWVSERRLTWVRVTQRPRMQRETTEKEKNVLLNLFFSNSSFDDVRSPRNPNVHVWRRERFRFSLIANSFFVFLFWVDRDSHISTGIRMVRCYVPWNACECVPYLNRNSYQLNICFGRDAATTIAIAVSVPRTRTELSSLPAVN